MVRLESQKHIDFALTSPFGGGGPGRVKRRKMKAAEQNEEGEEEEEYIYIKWSLKKNYNLLLKNWFVLKKKKYIYIYMYIYIYIYAHPIYNMITLDKRLISTLVIVIKSPLELWKHTLQIIVMIMYFFFIYIPASSKGIKQPTERFPTPVIFYLLIYINIIHSLRSLLGLSSHFFIAFVLSCPNRKTFLLINYMYFKE